MANSNEPSGTIAVSEEVEDSWIRCNECGRKLFWLEWAIFASILIACPSCKNTWRFCLGTVVEGLDRKEKT